MKKFKKKIIKFSLIVVIGYLTARYFWPGTVARYQRQFFSQVNFGSYSQVLGASQVNWLRNTAEQVIDFIGSWPIVQGVAKEATNLVTKEVEKVKQIPQQEAAKIKEDVREKVCEEWLGE